jgi:hypothetical protein
MLAKNMLICRLFLMRMRGLEPPPGCPDTDLNRAHGHHMRPPASRSSVSSGFRDASDASDDMTVAKVLPRQLLADMALVRVWNLLLATAAAFPREAVARRTPVFDRPDFAGPPPKGADRDSCSRQEEEPAEGPQQTAGNSSEAAADGATRRSLTVPLWSESKRE